MLAGTFFLAITALGGNWFAVLMILLAIIGFFEFARMNGHAWYDSMTIVGYLAMLSIVLPWEYWGLSSPPAMLVIWLLVFLLLLVTVASKNKKTIDQAALMVLGAVYVGYGFSAMIDARLIESEGLFWTALAFAAIWSSDIGAYFTGRAVGKHKLWPEISPNKTIEGALGGVLLSVGVAVIFALCAPDMISIGKAALIGLLAAVAGQLGDLMQSAYKRVKGIKDTGTLLPGHGGVLDRCDSWLIVFPLLLLTELIPLT